MDPIEPQLAKPLIDPKKLRDGRTIESELQRYASWAVEMKLDGHRRIMGRDLAWSRPRGPKAALKWVFSDHPTFQPLLPEGWVLDGELVPIDSVSKSWDVSHLLSHDESQLKFVVFDVLVANHKDIMGLPWSHRRKILAWFCAGLGSEARTRFELSVLWEDPLIAMAAASDLGLEGIMLKDTEAPYSPGSRSHWVKWKITDTVDVVITDCDSKPSEWTVRPGAVGADGILYPDGKKTSTQIAGHVGLSYGYWNEKTGQAERVGSLGWTGPRHTLEPLIGSVVEVKHYHQSPDNGALRHPTVLRLRPDKSPEQCPFGFQE